jgi:O-antigen/teichoic acid export membrane protein
MTEQNTSYRQIMKATSIFGGVQVFQIIIQVIRSKFIALLLGPGGMGIAGLLTSTIGLLGGLTNFGLSTSAVKEIAAADGSNNQYRVATIVIVLRRMVWITGTLGAALTLSLSPWLSQFTFGNHSYTYAFIWISITLLLTQLSRGQLAILQGMRKLQFLAKANLIGSALGLITTIPLYYIYGIDGIVPGIIVASITTLILSWYFSQKINVQPVKVSYIRSLAEGKNLLSLGFMISLSGIMEAGIGYIVLIFISHTGGAAQVGLYNAGFAIINTYVGLVFTAMGTDYYPRLSAVAHDNKLSKQAINQQAEIALLILAPILIVFMVFINWVVILLYSSKFVAINEMIYWAALGMFFKAASWSIAFIFLAKGTKRLFFWNELISKMYLLGFNLLGYYLFGLKGLGISFMMVFFVYLIQVYFVSKVKFSFAFDSDFLKIFVFQFSLAVAGFLSVKYLNYPLTYIFGGFLVLVSAWFSYKELDKRLGLRSILINIKRHI